jgi:hypothetical protein
MRTLQPTADQAWEYIREAAKLTAESNIDRAVAGAWMFPELLSAYTEIGGASAVRSASAEGSLVVLRRKFIRVYDEIRADFAGRAA